MTKLYHSVYLTSIQSTSCEMSGWMNPKLKAILPGEITTNSDDTTLMAESKEELKNLLMKEESEKSGLKLIEKSKIMALGPITSWHMDEEKVEAVSDFIYLCSKMSEGSDCSHEIKRRLLLRGKAMTNLGNILKSKDITLSTKLCLVKAMIFPVVMYSYKHWTIKKAEGQRIDT